MRRILCCLAMTGALLGFGCGDDGGGTKPIDAGKDMGGSGDAKAMDTTSPGDSAPGTDAADAPQTDGSPSDTTSDTPMAMDAVPDGGCGMGLTSCGGTCVDLNSSSAHCGACGM